MVCVVPPYEPRGARRGMGLTMSPLVPPVMPVVPLVVLRRLWPVVVTAPEMSGPVPVVILPATIVFFRFNVPPLVMPPPPLLLPM